MATISNRKGRWRAVVRKKNKLKYATFNSKEMAEIWSRFHEELIDNMSNFEVDPEMIVTLEDAIELKIRNFQGKVDEKTICDFNNCKENFKEIVDKPIGQITSDEIRKIHLNMCNSVVRRGGSVKNNTGSFAVCSTETALRKLRILAAVFSYMIKKGANITNVAQVVVNQAKMSMIKKNESLDD